MLHKDLRSLKNIDLNRAIIIDNSASSFMSLIENGIYIPSFYGDPEDSELECIEEFLIKIVSQVATGPQ